MPERLRVIVALLGLLAMLWSAPAAAQKPQASIKVLSIDPVSSGFITIGQRQDAERIRRLVVDALKRIDTAKVGQNQLLGIVGDYTIVKGSYKFSIRLIQVSDRKILKEIKFTIKSRDVFYPEVWSRELVPLFAEAPIVEPEPEPEPEPDTTTPPDGTTPPEGGEDTSGVPELPPISTEGESGTTTTTAEEPSASEDSGGGDSSGGAGLHGHFQNYTGLGMRRGFKNELLIFEERLQLEVGTNIEGVRVIGKPQLLSNVIEKDVTVKFRELYGERDYDTFEIAAGQQIVTWGVTDFWPIVDILNPRDLSQFRNWRPIDEKLAAPMLRATAYIGRATFHLIGIPILESGTYELDQMKPFALPIPVVPNTTVEQAETPLKLSSAGGGARLDIAVSSWKFSFYGLLGRDVIPSLRMEVDGNFVQRIIVQNERVGMGAVSAQGNIDSLGLIVRAEGAGYRRITDACETTYAENNLVSCFYFRHTPTARANISLERRILPGLDAHVQFISEVTRSKEIPRLSDQVMAQAPGLPEQYPWHRIVTLRLQGMYSDNDFRPMAFAYWSKDDEVYFGNVDLEYYFGDGFSLAAGGFWFKSYAKDPNKAKYTLGGSIESSSHAYVRATAWF